MNPTQTPHESKVKAAETTLRQIDRLNEQAWAMRTIDPAQAIELASMAGELSRENGGYERGEGWSLLTIGICTSSRGELDLAREALAAARDLLAGCGEREGESHASRGLGTLHWNHGEYAQALEQYHASLGICRQIDDRSGEANPLIGIASVHNARGEFNDAVVALEAAAEIARQYRSLGEMGAALEHLERHISLKEEVLGERTRQTILNIQASWQIELARREAEIERLRTVELKAAFDRLERAHEELKSAQSSLVQSEKMAGLGQLTAGIAHEINNPINLVSSSIGPLRRNHLHLCGVLTGLLDRLPDVEQRRIRGEEEIDDVIGEQEELIASIESGARRTAGIVAGLRSFSRLDEGGLKRVDLHEGLDATVTILSGSMSSGIGLLREYGDLPPVRCYPGEINQVFMNILTNAIKAIPGEGSVTIRTEAHDGSVSVSISDTGVGMTLEIQARIFEPFFTTRDVGEGRGLGLSIAWGIVEKHGGTIEVRSAPGEGSMFTMILPVA